MKTEELRNKPGVRHVIPVVGDRVITSLGMGRIIRDEGPTFLIMLSRSISPVSVDKKDVRKFYG